MNSASHFGYFTSGIVLELEAARCTGCGRCMEVCPHDIFRLEPTAATRDGGEKRQRLHAVVAHRERCMECGACALNCPARAIRARSGVGCATAIIYGMIKGTEPTCGCSGDRDGAGNSCGGSGCGCN